MPRVAKHGAAHQCTRANPKQVQRVGCEFHRRGDNGGRERGDGDRHPAAHPALAPNAIRIPAAPPDWGTWLAGITFVEHQRLVQPVGRGW